MIPFSSVFGAALASSAKTRPQKSSTTVAKTKVLVTRPAQDAGQWVQQLRQDGFAAEALPLIEIAPVSSPQQLEALSYAWQALDGYTACMFVSGNAVEQFFAQKEAIAQYRRAQAAIKKAAITSWDIVPPALRLMAPGPGTAQALLAAGVPAEQIDVPFADAAQFDSEALWQVVGDRDWQGSRVLLVRGLSQGAQGENAAAPGRDWIINQLKTAGADVDIVSVYQRRSPVFNDAQASRAKTAGVDGSVWLFSSSEAVANLLTMPGLAACDWHQARAVVTHPRIAATVKAAGWGVVVESRPALTEIVDTLRSIESAHP